MLNPLDSDARLQQATRALGETSPRDLVQTEAMLRNGLRIAPGDARLYSALALVKERGGDTQIAAALYDESLRLLPTELQALFGKLRFLVTDRRFADAVDTVDVIARRWADHWQRVDPLVATIAADRQGFEQLATRFAGAGAARHRLIASLSKSREALSSAQLLLLRWHNEGAGNLGAQVNLVTQRLIDIGESGAAYSLFRFSRDAEQAVELGLVNNARFTLPVSRNPFDWTLKRQAGMDLRQIPAQGDRPPGLSVRFLNNPIRLLENVSQLTHLSPGDYRLSVAYSQRSLRMPAPLRFAVRCYGTNRVLADMALDPQAEQVTVTSGEFSVPAVACALQQVYLLNKQLTESWKNRYRGTLILHQVQIERAGA